jgi:hypothetical protein
MVFKNKLRTLTGSPCLCGEEVREAIIVDRDYAATRRSRQKIDWNKTDESRLGRKEKTEEGNRQ